MIAKNSGRALLRLGRNILHILKEAPEIERAKNSRSKTISRDEEGAWAVHT